MAKGRRRSAEASDGNRTMQLDAVVDELEEVAPPPDVGADAAAPPPLPPKKPSKAIWIVGALVIVVAAGLGIGVGVFLLGDEEPAATAAGAEGEATGATPRETAAPPADQGEAGDQADDGAEGEGDDVVQMDEVVFGE
jgi:hypothetical protein